MVGRRVALLVATDRYQDTGLSRLAAPASDARQLAAVLGDIRIADFEVTTLYNKPHYVVGRAIGDLYRDRRRDDLTLLYFTGHGVKDEDGQLYLAMTDTDRENLPFTGVSSEQIRAAMGGSRSRQKVLVLDCCYAGAFPVGLGVKGEPSVHALEQLGGRGCVVMTSSDAMQLSFEGNQVTETGSASLRSGPSSLFTRFLIEGLRTGKADLDDDGDITVDELYSYVHDRVIDEQPLQRPKKKEDIESRICIAHNINWTIPSRISDAVNGPYPPGKLSALEELRSLHYRGNVIVKQRVLETVRLLAGDDSKSVSGAASQLLSEVIPKEDRRETVKAARREAGPAEPDVTYLAGYAADTEQRIESGLQREPQPVLESRPEKSEGSESRQHQTNASVDRSAFVSYSHKDERYRQQLDISLALLRRDKLIQVWHDRKILPGQEWDREIDKNLENADIVLLLVSPDFLASDYAYSREMLRAVERHESGSATVVPIILRPSDWQSSPLGSLEALPSKGRPVSRWSNRDQAWLDVVQGLRRLIPGQVLQLLFPGL